MGESVRNIALELVRGAFDLHVHAAPCSQARSLNDEELLAEADALGMAGVLVKNHYEPTSGRAAMQNLASRTRTTLYGSIVLNHSVGGINPYAVESAAKLGAKMVWMPTKDARNHIAHEGHAGFREREGITVLKENGELKKCVYDVFDVAKQYDIALSTGHLTMPETIAVCSEGRKAGVRMVLTHPEFELTPTPVAVQKDLADQGVLIEKDWINIAMGMVTGEYMAASIREVGPDRIYLATDRGQVSGERPAEGMLLYIETLLGEGVAPDEIKTMIVETPKKVLG
jgi:Predicted metal-dependent hydrolase with the TIM-barrel fold